ncbi:LacI family DNA-binding transcriptional regulator [Hungatella hathewayi]|uniref:HTH lacI-type domain-containing protein n=1 Tax=Hungatella hathewayi WAL-18680 TaxID=742737 RepID=G5I9T8_9FIRM|nr:LacI family DNA-binding transcriptional regulator [Hungatella hathewayi]EHI61827.1 hypothetical protein HMPREF9473_00278 [ [Hungatella hathewayi WAL-18680]
MRVTIKDIARETELSPTTVSIVLNNKPHRLSAETRKKVLDAAKRMNYRPNSLAASLKTHKTKTIGMVISNFTNSYFGELARGAEARCAQDGYALILCNTNDKSKKNFDYINILIDRGVDGIIISFDGIEADETDRLIAHMLSFGIKIISIDYRTQYKSVSNVMLDNKMGGFLATRHLIEQGHRKIGCITGPLQADSSTANQRYLGYKQALEKYQIEVNEKFVAYGEYNIESGIKHAGTLLSEGVTGIVAANDLCAYGIYKWAREHGITIPDDLSVVGYDDIVYSDFFSPRLTTIRQPAYDMGFEAANKIIESCEDISDGDKDLIFKPELVIGGSTRHL